MAFRTVNDRGRDRILAEQARALEDASLFVSGDTATAGGTTFAVAFDAGRLADAEKFGLVADADLPSKLDDEQVVRSGDLDTATADYVTDAELSAALGPLLPTAEFNSEIEADSSFNAVRDRVAALENPS